MAHGKRKWLDKFAFYKIGTLLSDSPKTIPIKAWQTKCLVKKTLLKRLH